MYSVLYQVIGFMYRTVLMYSVLYQVIGFMYHTVLMYIVQCPIPGHRLCVPYRDRTLYRCRKHKRVSWQANSIIWVHQDGPLHGRTVSQDQKWPSKLSEQLVNKSYTESGPIFHVDPNAIKSWHTRYQRSWTCFHPENSRISSNSHRSACSSLSCFIEHNRQLMVLYTSSRRNPSYIGGGPFT